MFERAQCLFASGFPEPSSTRPFCVACVKRLTLCSQSVFSAFGFSSTGFFSVLPFFSDNFYHHTFSSALSRAAVCLVSLMRSFEASALCAVAQLVYALVVTVDLSVNDCSGTVQFLRYLDNAHSGHDTVKSGFDLILITSKQQCLATKESRKTRDPKASS